jgi:DNA-binding NtrC family response regulator
MRDRPLSGCRILIVEDEAMIAFDLQVILEQAGAVVVGPVRTLAAAHQIAANCNLSAAILDVQLGDGAVFPIAKLLAERGIPFAFHSGYGNVASLQAEWAVDVIAKPAPSAAVVDVLAKACRRA